MATVAELMLKMGVDLASLRRDMLQAKDMVVGPLKEMSQAAQLFEGIIGGLAGAFTLDKLVSTFVALNRELDQLGKLSQNLNIPVEELSSLKLTAAKYGIEQFDQSLNILNRRIMDAQGGNQRALATFQALGIELSKGTTISQVLREMANSFRDHADGVQKSSIAWQLLGRTGYRDIAWLNKGAEGLTELKGATKAQVEEATKLVEEMEKTSAAIKRFGYEIVGQLNGPLLDLITWLKNAIVRFKEFRLEMQQEHLRQLTLPAVRTPDTRAIENTRAEIKKLEGELSWLKGTANETSAAVAGVWGPPPYEKKGTDTRKTFADPEAIEMANRLREQYEAIGKAHGAIEIARAKARGYTGQELANIIKWGTLLDAATAKEKARLEAEREAAREREKERQAEIKYQEQLGRLTQLGEQARAKGETAGMSDLEIQRLHERQRAYEEWHKTVMAIGPVDAIWTPEIGKKLDEARRAYEQVLSDIDAGMGKVFSQRRTEEMTDWTKSLLEAVGALQLQDVQMRMNGVDGEIYARTLDMIRRAEDEIAKREKAGTLAVGDKDVIRREAMDAAREMGKEIKEQYEYSRLWSTGWKEAMDSFVKSATNGAEQARQAFGTFISATSDLLSDFFMTGELDLKRFVNMIASTLIRLSINNLLGQGMQGNNWFSTFMGMIGGRGGSSFGGNYVAAAPGDTPGFFTGTFTSSRMPTVQVTYQNVNIGSGVSRGEVASALEEHRKNIVPTVQQAYLRGELMVR